MEDTKPSLYEDLTKGVYPVEPLSFRSWYFGSPSRGGNFKSETSDDPITEKAAGQHPAKPWSC